MRGISWSCKIPFRCLYDNVCGARYLECYVVLEYCCRMKIRVFLILFLFFLCFGMNSFLCNTGNGFPFDTLLSLKCI